jgi:hypothetical protein
VKSAIRHSNALLRAMTANPYAVAARTGMIRELESG